MSSDIISLLVVEDLETQRSTWRREIEEFNEDAQKGFAFEAIFAPSGDDALQMLSKHVIDCGIIDLRLPVKQGAEVAAGQGNKIISELIKRFPAPVAVVSGHPGEMAEDLKRTSIKAFSKDAENYKAALNWLASHRDLITSLKHAQSLITRETIRIFHGVLWPRWKITDSSKGDLTGRKATVVRQIVSHLAEELSLPGANTPRFAPEEFYVKPSIRERLHTGDILKLKDGLFIVLTPQCSIANSYPDYLIVAPCKEKQDWKDILPQLRSTNKEKRETAEKRLRNFSTQAHALSSHFIPPCDGEGPWLVGFDNIKTIPCNDEEIDVLRRQRVMSLAPRFLPNLVQRFASYMGRIGQPDVDVEELAKQLSTIYPETE
jgi:CheY-like chemotaxis protein